MSSQVAVDALLSPSPPLSQTAEWISSAPGSAACIQPSTASSLWELPLAEESCFSWAHSSLLGSTSSNDWMMPRYKGLTQLWRLFQLQCSPRVGWALTVTIISSPTPPSAQLSSPLPDGRSFPRELADKLLAQRSPSDSAAQECDQT